MFCGESHTFLNFYHVFNLAVEHTEKKFKKKIVNGAQGLMLAQSDSAATDQMSRA